MFILRKASAQAALRSFDAAGQGAIPTPARPDPERVKFVRIAYVIDLTRPGGMFAAEAFRMRNGDVIYVTDAPAARWLKILNALAPAVNFASSATALAP